MKPYLEVTSDFTKEFNAIIEKFKNDEVLVGIPEEKSDRSGDDDTGINNATLLAINVFGSPINNIPPRDVMTQGIRNAQDQIAEEYKNAVKFALSKGLSALSVYYNRVGIIASNSIKLAINNQDWPRVDNNQGPAPATLQARKYKKFSGTKSLIETGQMRGAITYVVRSS